ncbi:MAG: NAD-dependent epimerase/dehydratase family protein [Bacteroidia bacterium]|nr:NAD-dependent epimerase/dehydratase family protein [Bacteroidia bacterium]
MTNVLVTGGAGFIGAHVSRELVKSGYKVTVLDDLSGGFKDNVPKEVKLIIGSIVDHDLISRLFSEHKFKYVFHLAAYAAEGLSHFIKRYNYNNNLIGSVNLINESIKQKVKCFVFTSSIAVYGKGPLPLKEEMIPVPEDPYGIAKLAVEQELRVTQEMFGMDYIIFRPHNVYGEYQNIGDRYRNVVGIFMNQLMQNRPLTIFGNGNQSRAFSYIGDIAPLIVQSINIPQAYNEVYNIGADKDYSVNNLAQAVMDAMNIEGTIRHLPIRNEVEHAYSDHSKCRRIFKSSYSTDLKEGLQKMASWVKQSGVRKSGKFKEIEITEKLPPIWLED